MKKFLSKYNLYPDATDIKALFISFALINFVFLYNTLNFLWGNHDVQFVKNKLLLSSGLFEGRFTQFIPYCLLTNGQILPILNNLLGFLFLILGLWILAKYWDIPKSIMNYVLFITFFATQPYTLSWLYFTLNSISCFLWILIAILGLYSTVHISRSPHKIALFVIATLCFYFPLGGYPPIINTICVCLSAKIMISYLFENKTLKTLLITHIYSIVTFLLAGIMFKITLKIIQPDNVYNLETMPLSDIPQKFISILKISANQFILSLPFMEQGYKLILLAMFLTAMIGGLIAAHTLKKGITTLCLLCITILATATTTFLVIPHTEYVARIDFYGLAFLYTLALALLLKFKQPLAKSLALLFMFILLPLNIQNDYRAQKIWQQGFTAEFQILDRVVERIENHPNFKPNHKYRFRQLGDISLRPRYYKQKFTQNEPFLLDLPYLAMWQGDRLAEFYSPFSYISDESNLIPADITPECYHFMMQEAHPWPHQNSIYVGDNAIIIIFAQNELDDFRKMIAKLY